MGKEALILDFKVVTEPSGKKKIYLLESGIGLFSKLPDVLTKALQDEMQMLYPGKKILAGDDVLDQKGDTADSAYVPTLYEDLMAGKVQLPSLLVFDKEYKAQHAAIYVRQNNLSDIEVAHSNSIFYAGDKVFFAAICRQNNLPIPETWICSPNTMTLERLEIIKKACPNGVIIKPTNQALGEGVAFVAVEQLRAVVAWLHGVSTYNPLANEARFMEVWSKQPRGTVAYIIQQCIITAKTGHEPTNRIVFSINGDQIKIIGITEKYSFDAVKAGEKRNSKTIISCTKKAAEKYHLEEKKARVLDADSKEYADIAALMFPILKTLASITPDLDPIKVCMDEYKRDKTVNSDYIYFVLPGVANNTFKQFSLEQTQLLNECLNKDWVENKRNVNSLLHIFLAGYFRKGDDVKLPQYARTEAFFQSIVQFVMLCNAKDYHQAIKEQAQFCLDKDPLLSPKERMSDDSYKKTEALVKALTALIEEKPYPNIPCLYGPYSHYYLSNGIHPREDSTNKKNQPSTRNVI